MPPRGFTNPAPKTDSAREAVKSFYCNLCQKGYSRSNEYEAHLSSYDHSHKQRLKDMRQLSRDPMASEKARKAETKANEKAGLISIKLGGEGNGEGKLVGKDSSGGGGFKKGGFKKAGFKSAFTSAEEGEGRKEEPRLVASVPGVTVGQSLVESDTDDEGYEVYDPRHPTD